MQRCDALGAEFKYREAQRARRLVVVPRRYAAVMRDPRWAPSHQTLSTVRWDGYVAAPLEARGRVVGTLSAFYPSALTSAAQTEVDRLTVVADQAAAAVDNAGLLAKTRHWAVIAERNRLGRELHNAIMQLADQSRTLQASAAADGPVDAARIRADAAELVDLSGSALTALQALISGLRPVATRRLSALTPRELEVLALLAEGCSNQEIARRLAITERTARTHVSNLLGKLRLGSRTQAALLAHQEGLYGGSTQGGSYARG
jgi:DNA-binding CsgD family transcriptional regulator